MSSTFDRAVHPVLACADAIEDALKETTDVQVVFMDLADKRTALLRLARLDSRLTALRLRLMAVADDVALAEGARDVAALLSHETRGDFGATGVTWRWPRPWTGAGTVAAALGRGDLNVAQALVITRALDELPAEKLRCRGARGRRSAPGRPGGPLRST